MKIIKTVRAADISPREILKRNLQKADVGGAVRGIIDDVKARGDAALFDFTRRFDSAELTSFEVDSDEMKKALERCDPDLLDVMKEAAENIRAFHVLQKRDDFRLEKDGGIVLGQRVLPLESVGLYIPGGAAPYVSTVLMNCIPAKIAGVKEIIMTTPPAPDGTVNENILAAAALAGVDRVFKLGGAQAVAALAFGTESVPAVCKIVGPGNAFVAEAKRQVFGTVSIDMIAGPSEIIIIADEGAKPHYLAADMLSQAEHDRNASAVLITTSNTIAEETEKELVRQVALLPRAETAEASLRENGLIILADSVFDAIQISNQLAPEHLEICTAEPFKALDSVTNAGSVFLGENTPEALGDYFSGTNHTLPTGGTARFSSPLSVDDFVKKSCYSFYPREELLKVCDKVALFAGTEGFTAHAKSALARKSTK